MAWTVVDGFADIGRLRPLAHHPDCERYDHHLIRVGGRPLCLGCVSLTGGVVVGLAAVFIMPELLTWPAPALLGTCLLAATPAFLQPFVRRRPFKMAARATVGFGSALLWLWILASSIHPGWRLSGAVLFLGVLRLALLVRQRRIDNPCAACPFGHKPFCRHYLPQFERLRLRYVAQEDLEQAETMQGLIDAIRRNDVGVMAAIGPT